MFDDLLGLASVVDQTAEADRLSQAYLHARIVGPTAQDYALHVAMATVARCAVIVSWNFRHIVHFQKVPLYNAVNVANGYTTIGIHSPREVLAYDDQD